MAYLSLNQALQKEFGCKVYKISLQSGCSCPNRDGKIAEGGCIFCSEKGSGDFAPNSALSITEQLDQGRQRLKAKMPKGEGKYIAYFQSYTNTYAPAEKLAPLFKAAIGEPDVVGLSIATRPDCLPEDILHLLSELNQIKPLWVELGLQTIHERSAQAIRRGFSLACFEEALSQLHERNIRTVVHLILGLPGESREEILASVSYLARSSVSGIKLQLLHVLKNTTLADLYYQGKVPLFTLEEYIQLLGDALELLPPHMVIHRLTGDGPKESLLAPLWSANKRQVRNQMENYFRQQNICQGRRYIP